MSTCLQSQGRLACSPGSASSKTQPGPLAPWGLRWPPDLCPSGSQLCPCSLLSWPKLAGLCHLKADQDGGAWSLLEAWSWPFKGQVGWAVVPT